MPNSSPQSDHKAACHVCRSAVEPGATFCPVCGARVGDRPAEGLRYVLYMLSEIKRWEDEGLIEAERAAALRDIYEKRRDGLRVKIESELGGERLREVARARAERREEPPPVAHTIPVETPPVTNTETPGYRSFTTSSSGPSHEDDSFTRPSAFTSYEEESFGEKRTLIETLTDPHTLRLLLYTGAGMLVVGVVIWLRDVLYLKLQEPIVQATLLAAGTVAVTACGWFAILRTRLRLTGRALTLAGSLLVPVNFWFLVRSGLIENHGRAWMVCALCTALYATTAAVLWEKLYVYLAQAAGVATLWALVYRTDPEAFGMYALTLMTASLLFLHLSKAFGAGQAARQDEEGAKLQDEHEESAIGPELLNGELWGVPLARGALVGVVLAWAIYMPTRLGPTLSLREHAFQFWSHSYDAGSAALLFAAFAYAAWYAGRYLEPLRRPLFYTVATLALLWTEFLVLDGLRPSGRAQLLALSVACLFVSLFARRARGTDYGKAFYAAGAIASVLVLIAAVPVAFATELSFTHSAALAFLALSFAALSAPYLTVGEMGRTALAYTAAILAAVAFLTALVSAHIQSNTLFVAACATGCFALYAASVLAEGAAGEEQLATPLLRTADAGALLQFLWAGLIALISYLTPVGGEQALRPAMFSALAAAILYGVMRVWRERSTYGTGLASAAVIIFASAALDSLQRSNVWPKSWPVAAGVVVTAFLLQEIGKRVLREPAREGAEEKRALDGVVSLVADFAVITCAALWFISAMLSIDEGGAGASVVLFLALCYWAERAARKKVRWLALIAAAHAAAFFLALLVALRVEVRWFATLSVLVLFPLFFMLARFSRERGEGWAAPPTKLSAATTLALAAVASFLQLAPDLRVGERNLLAPAEAFGSIALVTFVASYLSRGLTRARYFRAGLCATVLAFWLACLRGSFHPWYDVEVYTAPVGVLVLVIAYLAVRREWGDYARDAVLLLWTGSILLAGPLLIRALQFRLLLDTPAPLRDLVTLFVSLLLIIFSVFGRLRAPMVIGATTLVIELAALALTSVDWLQVPLKLYLITVGALILVVWGTLEHRREQLLALRRKLHDQREHAREQFGQWR